jgi:hypothetical protein
MADRYIALATYWFDLDRAAGAQERKMENDRASNMSKRNIVNPASKQQ